MFSASISYPKLKTNLRLALNRLKLLETKKTELAQKSRKEIADYISAGKYERARIRVEHIIREDYMVEGLELLEIYCDLLLSRFGLLQQCKTVEASLAEAVSSIVWASPRVEADVGELKVITEQLSIKFGKKYVEACQSESIDTISEKLKHKLGVQPPPKILVEKYLMEIARNYNIPYEPDTAVLREADQSKGIDSLLFDNFPNDSSGQIVRPTGFVDFSATTMPFPGPPPELKPFNYPTSKTDNIPINPPSMNVDSVCPLPPTSQNDDIAPPYPGGSDVSKMMKPPRHPNLKSNDAPTAFKSKIDGDGGPSLLSQLPSVPDRPFCPQPPGEKEDEIDFDDLLRRFDELKKKG